MLQIKNLNMTHTKDSHVLSENLSFVLNEGDKAAIIGEEGNGKSTLLKLIYDPELVENYIEYSGEIINNGEVFGYLAQEISDAEGELSVAEFCQKAGFAELLPYEVHEIAADIGIEAEVFDSERKMKTLSGGEKGRVSLAKIMLSKANTLMLDEPTNHLDMFSKEVLESAITRYEGTCIYISHDRYFINKTAEKILELTPDGVILYNGNYDYYLEKKAERARNEAEKALQNPQKTTASAPAQPISETKNDWLKQKEQQAAERKLANKIKKVETEIEETEAAIAQADEDMAACGTDFSKANEIFEQKTKLEEKLEKLFEEWEELHS